ncbi:MAG: hypothetical protein K8T20_14160, partial [Planctomycetes bacterium]|nr:hypothetical protein [Planctomycetota bacterium]
MTRLLLGLALRALTPLVVLAQAAKPAEGLTAAESKEAEAAIKAWFEAKADGDRAAAIERLRAIDHP